VKISLLKQHPAKESIQGWEQICPAMIKQVTIGGDGGDTSGGSEGRDTDNGSSLIDSTGTEGFTSLSEQEALNTTDEIRPTSDAADKIYKVGSSEAYSQMGCQVKTSDTFDDPAQAMGFMGWTIKAEGPVVYPAEAAARKALGKNPNLLPVQHCDLKVSIFGKKMVTEDVPVNGSSTDY